MIKDMHFKEDTSKPENRVNITLFHLLMIKEFKSFIIQKLGLDVDCVVYPAPDLVTDEFSTNDRPDFKVEINGKLVAYIEVELGKDLAQVKKYKDKTPDDIEIYCIFGKISDGGNLSLEEIYSFVKKIQVGFPRNTQEYWSMELLLKMVKYYVIDGNFNSNNKRTSISPAMRDSALITAFYECIGSQYIIEGTKAEKGKLLIDTVKENGFSVRIFARNSSSGSFSLMNRSGGRETINFPAHVKMKKYIYNKVFIERYTNLLISIGCADIKEIEERQTSSLAIKKVEDNITELCDCIKLLLF